MLRKRYRQFILFAMSLLLLFSCQDQQVVTERALEGLEIENATEDEAVAPMFIRGLGSRQCVLNFSYATKMENDFKVLANDRIIDNIPGKGFGRECLHFCVAAFQELRSQNEEEGRSILIRKCSFSDDLEKFTDKDLKADIESAEFGLCEIIAEDGGLIPLESENNLVRKARCEDACDTNRDKGPACKFKGEKFAGHKLKQCRIGAAPKYDQKVSKVTCAAECERRNEKKGNKVCTWGNSVTYDPKSKT